MQKFFSQILAFFSLAAIAVSCSGIPKPSLPKIGNLPLIGKKKRNAAFGTESVEVSAKPRLRGAGVVEFRGFSTAALADFRVIPEKGGQITTPQNQVYQGVDGFWWKHQRGLWFKIPNHCSVVVQAAREPVIASAFVTNHDCGNLGVGIHKLRGKPVTPKFYPDSGSTAHETDYPFAVAPPVVPPAEAELEPEF